MLPPIAIVDETMRRGTAAAAPGIIPLADEEPIGAATPRYVEAKQEEMQFEAARGRFDKTAETIYRGENLDQPTYRRRRLSIRL